MAYELVVIGASWGGLQAVGSLLAALPGDLDAAIVVAQHRSPDSGEGALARMLAIQGELAVADVYDKEPVTPGMVHLAPPDYHLAIEPAETPGHAAHFSLSLDERVNYSRPSIDVLFESAAGVYGDRVIGVILTGANHDGAAGLRRIRERGGLTLVQDPRTARRSEMPAAAIEACAVHRVLPVTGIAELLTEMCGSRARSAP